MSTDGLDFSEPPDLSGVDYTIVIPHDVACELLRGNVPVDVLTAIWSGIRAMTETPAEAIRKPRQTRTRKDAA